MPYKDREEAGEEREEGVHGVGMWETSWSMACDMAGVTCDPSRTFSASNLACDIDCDRHDKVCAGLMMQLTAWLVTWGAVTCVTCHAPSRPRPRL